MTSSYSAKRDKHFWSGLRYGQLRTRSWGYGMTYIEKRENAVRVFMTHNFENTESWEDKPGNT